MRPGEPVAGTGHPLSVVLAPGLIGQTFDGIQRPLELVRDAQGIYLRRGAAEGMPDRAFAFTPEVAAGDAVAGGAVLGRVPETPLIEHRVLVPPGIGGEVVSIAAEGALRYADVVARVRDAEGREHEVTLAQRWPVRRPRPFAERLEPNRPLITGQRVLDTFFPLVRGGSAALPGPFGTGKTVLQHSLAKWSDAQVIVYVGCGERGNEMTAGAAGVPRARRPAQRAAAHGANDPRRQHLEHAGRRARGEHLHRHHAGRVLPRHGLPRRADGRLHLALGRGAARDRRPPRGDAGRGGLPRLPPLAPRGVLRARRAASTTLVGRRGIGDGDRRGVARRAATSPSRSRSTRSASRAPSGRSTASSPAPATTRRSAGAGATASTPATSPAGGAT